MVSNNRTYYAPHLEVHNAPWQVEHRPESGTYVSTAGGVLLFRVGDGILYFWDRRQHCEISINIEAIVELAG